MQTRTAYLKQLEDLENSLTRMAEKVEADINASASIMTGQVAASDNANPEDDAILSRMRSGIEGTCLDIMLMQQPLVAGDLRFVTGSFRIVSDLAHIGEKARSSMYLAGHVPAGVAAELCNTELGSKFIEAATTVVSMIGAAISAFRNSDVELAEQVFKMDDLVDDLYVQIQQAVIAMIRASEENDEYLPELLMIAKYYERMGDDAQRIAAWAVFRVTGVHGVNSAQD